jgi:hypothetical protein
MPPGFARASSRNSAIDFAATLGCMAKRFGIVVMSTSGAKSRTVSKGSVRRVAGRMQKLSTEPSSRV